MVDTLIEWCAQRTMYVVFAAAAVMFYINGIVAVESGWWGLLFPGMLVISPVMMALLRIGFEGPLDRSFFNPRVMSWAFVVGDFMILPLALWFAGRGRHDVSVSAMSSLISMLICAGIGVFAMLVFRKVDGNRYRSAGWASSLSSPTKVWHDCVVMPVVVALLLWMLIPQFIWGGSGDTVLSIVFLAIFGFLVGADAWEAPDPRLQHPKWDTVRFEAITT